MPNRLSKLFSSSAKEKEALAEAERNRSSPPPEYDQPPPEYDEDNVLDPPDITAGFTNLNISNTSQSPDGFPQPAECIAHLKVLECFYRLKQTVGSTDGLFGIEDKFVTGHTITQSDKTGELLAKLAEKRWAVYLHRAVDRFETWSAAVTPSARMATRPKLETQGKKDWLLKRETMDGPVIRLDKSNMPPADVLMVWHAYMLNPRAYLEDCLRYGRMPLWHTPMPWKTAADCINSETFAYEPEAGAEQSFTSLTGLPWDNLADTNSKSVRCPKCNKASYVPWTTCFGKAPKANISDDAILERSIDEMLMAGRGYCDKDFIHKCFDCNDYTTHDALRAGKYRNDVKKLIHDDVPMAGTVLGHKGIPWMAFGKRDLETDANDLPNELFKGRLGKYVLAGFDLRGKGRPDTVEAIKDLVEAAIKNSSYLREAKSSFSTRLTRSERIAIRKMMSRYWENSSPFALDLVGAVIRQGSFIEKMHNIDWLHSPALPSTMARLVKKYQTFMTIMADHPLNMAVPTLDVDLAWHTHQLSPHDYMEYTVLRTRQFIDHDDKVVETKLNDSFAWTSKIYQKITGEPYSECTCWYCEAIRESNTSATSRLFNTSTARANDMVHAVDQDPRKSVHISAHNAVRPHDQDKAYDLDSRAKAYQLEKHYQKACERARKKGKPEPKRNDYYYSDAWGYPVYIPAYSPYIGFVPYAPMYYPVTPGCMAVGAGAVGNCCSGTCGAGIAAGGTCASSGGCAGGAVGCGGGGAGGGCGGGGGGGGGGCGGGGGGGC
ncbi:hypothetical protein M409DRAFT_51114 [Zasmidium cellare ATCC 36951]|uniref:Glycine-rich domain-containing protein n=1 Tax=Zasmidium cellare ATCC 36951 TaxID=1080233 RepID=A0A6A6CZR2_ZASCE|nr:uncharacterized protein M409DRAFT_51114 [Zasmidium cellare ATCC 36951]KAF2170866.1 hypothetical protein M409DRAFT_51114 [Zasmidium cellare ATCC 36951]